MDRGYLGGPWAIRKRPGPSKGPLGYQKMPCAVGMDDGSLRAIWCRQECREGFRSVDDGPHLMGLGWRLYQSVWGPWRGDLHH